jgi:sarcosine oxidase
MLSPLVKTESPEILVAGLGAMGSATAFQLARRGAKVVAIDQFTPPHTLGSSHGETRITREAIGEGLDYVPLAMRSHQLWREIESETGTSLFNACGGIVIARTGQASRLHAQDDFLGNTFRAAEQFNIRHERLNAAEIAARYPQFMLQGDEFAYYEPGAGYLAPEACVSAQLTLAARHGADLRFGERVMSMTHEHGKAIVQTDRARYTPAITIVCAGPWVLQLLQSSAPQFVAPLNVRRQVLYWFQCNAAPPISYREDRFPIFIWNWGPGEGDVFYGFPQLGEAGAIKVATSQHTRSTTPESVQREVTPAEIAAMYSTHLAGKLRGVSAHCTKAVTCLYTDAPDAKFVMDRLPDAPGTIVVSACSGHGFKHSAAIGEAVATMALTNATPDVFKPFAMVSMPRPLPSVG